MIVNYQYDNEGYLAKALLDSYSDNNPPSYGTYIRENKNLIILNIYVDNILTEVRKMYLDNNGLCTFEVDSNAQKNKIRNYVWRKYNEKHQLIYQFIGDDTTNGEATKLFYDSEGNKIKKIYYNIYDGDTLSIDEFNKVLYKGYLMDPEDIEYFEFDSENRIVGFTNTDFGNTKYKIEYEYYK
jgi:ribosomal protein L23